MLFIENSYLKEFKAQIEEINNNYITLKNTAFYAKSGGQPGDTGEIIIKNTKIKVIDTIYNQYRKIIHICDQNIEIDKKEIVIGKINWDHRYKYMKMHSALHLLCSLIPYEVTGGQISFNKSRLDFNDRDKKIAKEEIEEKINKLVKEDHIINYQWITNEELSDNPELVRTMSVKPPHNVNKIRLVKIGDIDLQPCGGTHVKSTIEIGKIIISKIENKGRMNRRVNLVIND